MYPITCGEDVMKPKAHGTSEKPVQVRQDPLKPKGDAAPPRSGSRSATHCRVPRAARLAAACAGGSRASREAARAALTDGCGGRVLTRQLPPMPYRPSWLWLPYPAAVATNGEGDRMAGRA